MSRNPNRRSLPARLAPAAVILWCLSVPASAVAPEQWRVRSAAEFGTGELRGVGMGEDGALRLAPRLEELYAAADPYLWALVTDRKGALYAGSGDEGRVFRVRPGKGGETLFDSDELEVHGLAFGKDGRLFAATSPDGKVYRIRDAGDAEVFFDPGQVYIWDLATLPGGDLLVATGPEGILFRVGADGEGRVWFDSEDTHIRSLLVAPDGTAFAGTSGQGLVVRISPEGVPFVLHDSPLEEIVDLARSPDGTLYAAALASQRREAAPLIEQPPRQPGEPADQQQAEQRQQQQQRQPPPRTNVVYRIDPEGGVRDLWRTDRENLFSLLWSESDGILLVGTGEAGRLLGISPKGEVSERIRVGATQITALAAGQEGVVYLATSNLGFVSRFGGENGGEGEYLSPVKDARTTSDWGTLTWKAETPPGTSVQLMVRTGNTADPDRTWSDWSAPSREAGGTRIDRPRARYVQWKAILAAEGRGKTPVLREVVVPFLQQNLPPDVTSVVIQGQVAPPSRPAPPPAKPRIEARDLDIASSPQPAAGVASPAAAAAPGTPAPPPQPETPPPSGQRTVRWTAVDPNGDKLLFSVFFRGESERLWKPLEDELEDRQYTWDATALPDGVYQIRVVATDRLSTPVGEALEGEAVSESFFVDTTPPRVEDLEARVNGSRAEVTFLATDSFSPIGTVQYSVDAQEWRALYPDDRVADSGAETFRFETGDLVSGEHTIVVRASDELGNRGSGKIVVEVP